MTIMNKIIITDVDGTLVDFGGPFHYWMDMKKYVPTCSLNDVFEISTVFGCSEEDARNEVELFCASPVFAHLPALQGTREAISRLKAEGWQIIAVTSCAASPEAREMRQDNLYDLFGITDVRYAGLMGSKTDILKTLPPAIWVDDHLAHIHEGIEANHTCFVIDKKYNRQTELPDDSYHRVVDWGDIVRWLEQNGLMSKSI